MRTDEQLMESYVECQEQRAFAELYRRHQAMLRRVVARRVFGQSDVEDVVQQVFMQLHAARDRYRRGQPLRPWLCTIAINLCRDHARKQIRRAETALDTERLGAAEPAFAAPELEERNQPVLDALESLSEVTQHIFREHFLQDRALVEIARELGANPNTVRVRLHRGCLELRNQLQAAS